jgi:GxxExxY protein
MPQIPPHRSAGNAGHRLAHARLTREVIGVFFDVYNELGFGLPESVYRSAMHIVLAERGLAARSEVKLNIHFHGHHIGSYRADMIVEDKIILELKAGASLPLGAKAQLINYLRLSRLEVGLLLFFGPSPDFMRVVLSRQRTDGH